jgi:hypothetical protein
MSLSLPDSVFKHSPLDVAKTVVSNKFWDNQTNECIYYFILKYKIIV